MKLSTKIIVSAFLALIATFFISSKMHSSDNLSELLHKTELTDLNGKILKRKELRNKVVILSYFQTWCGDCVKEQPDLLKLQSRFGDSLKILFVSDEPVDLIKAYMVKFPSELRFYHTNTSLKKNGIVKHFPTTYMMDKKGDVKETQVEGIHWYTPEIIAKIEQMLAH